MSSTAVTVTPATVAPVTVTPVRGRADTTAFIRLPYAVYRDDPHWVAPLERERRAFLDPGSNPFFETGAVRLFLARRGRTPVGRIAAVIDPRFQSRHDARCGHFGLFECADDTEAAAALLDAAAGWLAERGLDRMLGPLSFSTNDECGVLVDGFDGPPTVLMPYNRPYYSALLEGCGFVKAMDLLSYRVPMSCDGEPPAAVGRTAEQVLRTPGTRIRPMDPARFEADMAVVRSIYNDAWAENYASIPLTDSEFAHWVRELRPFLPAELLQIAEVENEPVAFVLWLPDINQALRAARGRLTSYGLPLGLLRFRRALRTVDRARLVALGIKQEYRGSGMAYALLTESLRAAYRLGYTERELSWVLEDNRASNGAARAVGGVHFRTHRLYERRSR
ncbi:N-acetyltransferase family protein [Streptomyces sp. NPDC003006]